MSTNTNQHSHKVLGLSSASLIKRNVLGDVEGWMNTLYNSITDEYRKEILTKINNVWNEFDETSLENKLAILDEISGLYAGKQETQEALNALRESIKALENGEDESVLDEEAVKKILTASLVDKSFWTDEMIGAPSVLGQEIIGLIGTFGKIQAGNIEGDLIEGKSIQSIPDSDGNTAWKLDNTGGGHLANGNIYWDADGKVTLGSDVTIKWDNIDGRPEINDDDLVGVPGEDGITPLLEIREDYWYVSYDNGETWTKLNKATGEQGPAGADGKDGLPGADGKSIVSTTCEYGLSTDENIEPETWTTDVPELVKGTYLWTKTTWTYNEGDPEYGYTKTYISKDGNDGKNGLPGKDGTKIVSTTFEYGLSTDENTEPKEWTLDVPELVKGMYLWTKMTWKYSDETEETGYTKTYISKDGEQGPKGESGQTPVIHTKYANEVVYNPDGTVASVEWTNNNGEDPGNYQGMYVDYNDDLENESTNFNDYSWTMVNPEKAVITELGKYKITSNTISGKTIQSTKNVELEENTTFETHNADGTFNKLIESDGSTEGPAWQLRDSGEGYLAQGNIRWDEKGDVTFGEGVKLTWNSDWDNKIPEVPEQITDDHISEIVTTTITKDYIESKEIIAKDIKGDTISGKTIQSGESTNGEPNWKIDKEGVGHFAKGNFKWDKDGNVTLGGFIDSNGNKPIITIGDAWETDKDGNIFTSNKTAKFASDGSGYLGKENEGLSWDENGNITINSQLKYNFQKIEFNNNLSENDAPTLKISDSNKYLFVDSSENVTNDNIFNIVWLNWWSKDAISADKLIDIDIINGSSKTLVLKCNSDNERSMYVPIRKQHNYGVTQFNFVSTPIGYSGKIVGDIYILPGTTAQLQMYKDNEKIIGYVKNIGQFQLVSWNDGDGIESLINFSALCSIAPEHNNSPINNVNLSADIDDIQYSRYTIDYTLDIPPICYYDSLKVDFKYNSKLNNMKLFSSKWYFSYDDIDDINTVKDTDTIRQVDLFDYNDATNDLHKLHMIDTLSILNIKNYKEFLKIDESYGLSYNSDIINEHLQYKLKIKYYIPEYGKSIESEYIDLSNLPDDGNALKKCFFKFNDDEKLKLVNTLYNATNKYLRMFGQLIIEKL